MFLPGAETFGIAAPGGGHGHRPRRVNNLRRPGLSACVVALVVTAACGRSPETYVERGDALFRAGKLADAEIQYQKAIQRDANFGEAYLRLGLSQLARDDSAKAYDSLANAIRLLPGSEEAEVAFAELNLQAFVADPGRSERFRRLVVSLTSEILTKNSRSADGWRLRGALALLDKQSHAAVEAWQRALALRKDDSRIVAGLVEALYQDGKPKDGEREALSFLTAHPDASPLYDVLYAHYRASGKLDDAAKLLLRKIEKNPGNPAFRVQLARHYADAGKKTEMAAALQPILEDSDRTPPALLLVGDFYNSINDHDAALRILNQGLEEFPQSKDAYRKKIAATLVTAGKLDQAEEIIDSVVQDIPRDAESRLIRANLLIQKGGLENLHRAAGDMETAAEQNPRDGNIRFNLGLLLYRIGDLDGAQRQWAQASGIPRTFVPAKIALAGLNMSLRQPGDALREAEEVLAVEPRDPRPRILQAAANTALGNLGAASDELEALAGDYPQSEDVQLQLAVLDISEQKFHDAEQIFNKLHGAAHSDAKSAAGLAEIYSSQQQYDRALQLLQVEWKKSPKSGIVGDMVVLTAVLAGRRDLAIDACKQRIEESPETVALYLELGQMYLANGKSGDAAVIAERGIHAGLKDPRLEILAAVALRQAGRDSEVRPHLERARDMDTHDPLVLNNLAYLLSENGGNLDVALRLAQRARRSSPDEPHFTDTLGWIYLRKQKTAAALEIFEKLAVAYPHNSTYHYHLGSALIAAGDKARARQELQTALSAGADVADQGAIREMLARLH